MSVRGAAALIGAGVLASVGACGGGGQAEVPVPDLQAPEHFYEGEYLGERVVVSDAKVVRVHGPERFELVAAEAPGTRVTVLAARPVELVEGEVVRVEGTSGQVRQWSPSQRLPHVQHELYAKRQTKTYLYDALVFPRS
ncbi:hypothetical protein [Saccharopolyspora sp. CA-218241]|uniref:hypothetical protein n=1 Tax=Saccharopolyspora sp. CA-218241 TaxID=3240027 RepID=UPI003D988450